MKSKTIVLSIATLAGLTLLAACAPAAQPQQQNQQPAQQTQQSNQNQQSNQQNQQSNQQNANANNNQAAQLKMLQ